MDWKDPKKAALYFAENEKRLVILAEVLRFDAIAKQQISEVIKIVNYYKTDALQKQEIPNLPEQSQPSESSDSGQKVKFLHAVNALADEKDDFRWKAKLEAEGFKVFAIATSNGSVWFETNSMQGDTMCALRFANNVFVVPSPTDPSLRSSQLSSWFNIIGSGPKYRLSEVATGEISSGGGYLPLQKGTIMKED